MRNSGIARLPESLWASPLKSDGSWRTYEDYLRLDTATIDDRYPRYPIPHIADFKWNLVETQDRFSQVITKFHWPKKKFLKTAVISLFGLFHRGLLRSSKKTNILVTLNTLSTIFCLLMNLHLHRHFGTIHKNETISQWSSKQTEGILLFVYGFNHEL